MIAERTTMSRRLWSLGIFLVVALIAVGCELEDESSVESETKEVECEIYGGIIDVGSIPECIQNGEFDDDSFSRVKVRGSSPSHLFGNSFKIHGWDSQDRGINAIVSVDHQETYETLLRLGGSDWINLSCYYSSYEKVKEYTEGGDKAYAIVHLNDCIDLK